MGQDKALKLFLGRPLIFHTIEQLKFLSEDIFVVVNCPANYSFLGLQLYQDIKPGLGPLGGIYTTLSVAKNSLVAVVGCDMPFSSLPLFEYERNLIIKLGVDVVIPSTPHGLEPLHAVYRPETCLPFIKSAIEAGERKITCWFHKIKVHVLSLDETEKYTPLYQAFINLNTPEEFQQAEQSLLAQGQPKTIS